MKNLKSIPFRHTSAMSNGVALHGLDAPNVLFSINFRAMQVAHGGYTNRKDVISCATELKTKHY